MKKNKMALDLLTTLCYLIRDDRYLMLHRVKKEGDLNKDKWIGVGGHFEEGESPEDCVRREVLEETGLTLLAQDFRGVVTFVYQGVDGERITEYMHLFTSTRFSGIMTECEEGELEWIPICEAERLPIWEGDKIFFRLLRENRPFFSLKLCYEQDELTEAVLDGTALEISQTGPADTMCRPAEE